MNRIFVFLLLFMITFVLSCRNISEFTNEDAERNTWLAGFLQDKKIIEGKFNHSENIIEFFIEVDSIDTFLSKADSIASVEGWRMDKFDSNFRIYAKEMKTEGGISEVYILKMKFIPPNLIKINTY